MTRPPTSSPPTDTLFPYTTLFRSIRIKRIYDAPASTDGKRVLVDRIWPRGVSKEFAKLDLWLKEVAPSTDLRKWFDHNPARFEEFRNRYRQEMEANYKDRKSTRLNSSH